MIDTLMAFWNQNRRKRAAQILLTFLLMCISISLLFVAMSLPQWSHTHPQANAPVAPVGTRGADQSGQSGQAGQTGQATATTPIQTTSTVVVGSTVGPSMTPTSTIVVPSQTTPTPGNGASSCSTPNAQVYITSTSVTEKARNVQDGGGPINIGTPVPGSTSGIGEPGGTNEPSSTPAATATPQPVGGGWTSPCTGNDIASMTGPDIVAILGQNLWKILGISFTCTALLYAGLWAVSKKR